MPIFDIGQLADKSAISGFLRKNEWYAAYALADLEPPYEAHTTWYGAQTDGEVEGLAMIFDGLEPASLFLMGSEAALNALMMYEVGPEEVIFSVQPENQPVLDTWYSVLKPTPMFRLRLTKDRLMPVAESRFPLRTLAHSGTHTATPVARGDSPRASLSRCRSSGTFLERADRGMHGLTSTPGQAPERLASDDLCVRQPAAEIGKLSLQLLGGTNRGLGDAEHRPHWVASNRLWAC